MEDALTLEEQIKRYEVLRGPLSDSYPFESTLYFKGKSSSGEYAQLHLYPDGNYFAECIMGAVKEYKYFKWKVKGTYIYNASDRKLILTLKQINSNWEWDFKVDPDSNTVLLDCFSKTFSNIEIPNYFWMSKTINFPTYEILKVGESNDYDFLNPVLSSFEMTIDPTATSILDEMKQIEIDILIKQNPSKLKSTIDQVQKYSVDNGESITLFLNPDNSFTIYDRNKNWDRDGSYNWDCSFNAKGRWLYDSSSRVMKLFYDNSEVDENGRQLSEDEINSHNIPKEVETNEFYFEGVLIRAICPKWSYSSFYGVEIREYKKLD
jgi:hypothetical protein